MDLRGTTAIALLGVAFVTLGCGGDAVEDSEPVLDPEVPLNQVISDPQVGEVVTVTGRASPLGELGFILEQQGVSVFVEADPEAAAEAEAEDGETLVVTASIEKLTQAQAADIPRAAKRADSEAFAEEALASTDVSAGAPYLDLIHLDRAGG